MLGFAVHVPAWKLFKAGPVAAQMRATPMGKSRARNAKYGFFFLHQTLQKGEP